MIERIGTANMKCPHCKENTNWERIKGPDEMMDMIDEFKELWQCSYCDGYFILKAYVTEIIPLDIRK